MDIFTVNSFLQVQSSLAVNTSYFAVTCLASSARGMLRERHVYGWILTINFWTNANALHSRNGMSDRSQPCQHIYKIAKPAPCTDLTLCTAVQWMAQAVNRRLLTEEARVLSQASPCGIYGDPETDLSQSTSFWPHSVSSTGTSYSQTALSMTVHSLGYWQRC